MFWQLLRISEQALTKDQSGIDHYDRFYGQHRIKIWCPSSPYWLQKQPHQHQKRQTHSLTVSSTNDINGGEHANNNIDIQEFMILLKALYQ